MSQVKNISGVETKSLFSQKLHDDTFGPTGLWQLANGAIGTDSIGSATLTQDATHGAATQVGGYTPTNQALQDFIYWRNDAADFQYTGAMSFACMFKATSYTHSGISDNYYRIVINGRGGVTDDRFGFYFNPTGYLYYAHKNALVIYSLTLSELHYDLYRWHHLAFTRDSAGTKITVYMDGAQIHQSTLASAAGTTGTTYFNLGGMNGYNGGAYDGITQATCVLFDKELSSGQIEVLAARCLV